jgi:predicted GNAT family N-acyltransferase
MIANAYRLEWITIPSPEYQQACLLRYQLFYQVHGLPFEIALDRGQPEDDHAAILTVDRTVLAYGRLSQVDSDTYQIFQIVVTPTAQGQGLGRQILQALIDQAECLGARHICLEARTTQLGFYRKLGFTEFGEIFPSSTTGVPHIQMRRSIKS